jgi:hypothetical protein
MPNPWSEEEEIKLAFDERLHKLKIQVNNRPE